MTLYRAEVFDRSFAYINTYQVANRGLDLVEDYIVQNNSQIVIPGQVIVDRKDYVRIRRDGTVVFAGIIEDFSYDQNLTTVNLRNFLSLFDLQIYMNSALLPAMSLERYIGKYIEETFDGSDDFQTIHGLRIEYESETFGELTIEDDDLYNLYDVIVEAFKVYGVVMKITLDVTGREFIIRFCRVSSDSIFRFSTQSSDVLKYTISVTGTSKKKNKIRYLNDEDLTEEITYYWHPNEFEGTIDTDGTRDRALPVAMDTKRVKAVEERRDKDGNVTREAKTFQQVAYDDAVKSMYQDRWNTMIEASVKKTSEVVPIGEIGQLYRIYDGDFNYPTILTSIEQVNDNIVLLTFGTVRRKLTQILKLGGI